MTARVRAGFLPIVMVTLVAVSFAAAAPNHSAAGPPSRYTMVAFSNVSETHMDVYESSDAAGYRPLRRPAYRPPFGLVRDPSIFRHTDGFYYVVYTTGWDGSTIGFARSQDRINWTFLRYYPVPFCCIGMPGTGSGAGSAGGLAGLGPLITGGSSAMGSSNNGSALSPFVNHAWAPVWFADGDRVHIIVSLSSGGDFVPYLMTALDPGLTLWSLPVPLAGIGANHIDTILVKLGPEYHAFTKNETTKFVEHATGPSPTGPFRFVGTGDWARWGRFLEGQSLVQLDNGTWRIYLDSYLNHRYFYSDSTDGLRTWSRLRELPGLSGHIRHFTVLKEPG